MNAIDLYKNNSRINLNESCRTNLLKVLSIIEMVEIKLKEKDFQKANQLINILVRSISPNNDFILSFYEVLQFLELKTSSNNVDELEDILNLVKSIKQGIQL